MKRYREIGVALMALLLPPALPAAEPDAQTTTFRPFARLHLDAGAWRTGESDRDEELRRARLGASGRLGDRLRYRVELDAIDSSFDPVDFWIQWRQTGSRGRLTVGHQQVPIGLDAMRGSERLFFMERGLPTALTPGYRFGVLWRQKLSDWGGLAVGAFGDRVRSLDEIDSSLDGESSVDARVTRVFRLPNRDRIHLGLAVDHRWPDNGTERFRARPETRLGRLRFVDTRRIDDVDTVTAAGLELAVLGNRWSFSAEHVGVVVRRDGLQDLGFQSWSGSFVWTFTDGTWRYDRRLGRVTGRPPVGVWSLGLRLSDIDLQSRDVEGGRERNLTLSAARRLTDRLRIVVEAGHARGTDRNGDAIDFERLQLRLQLSFR